MLKKIAIALVVLIVLAGTGLYYTWSNLDHFIKVAIEKYGSAATQTAVRLESVKLSLSSGEGALNGLSVSNPKGFSDSLKAFELGSISVSVDASSLRGTGPIVIKSVTIEKPLVNYEVTGNGESNLQALQRNTMAYANAMSGGKGKKAEAPKPANDNAGGRKVVINDLYVRNGQIGITSPVLQGKGLNAPLPTIHMTGIGKNSGGATAAQVAQQVLGAIGSTASQVAASDLAKQLGSQLKGVAGNVSDTVGGKVGDQVKGFLGQ